MKSREFSKKIGESRENQEKVGESREMSRKYVKVGKVGIAGMPA